MAKSVADTLAAQNVPKQFKKRWIHMYLGPPPDHIFESF